MAIPLPPLSEQRRIVTEIESLAAKIDEARRLREQSIAHADALVRSIIFAGNDHYPRVAMHELLRRRMPDTRVEPAEKYSFAGVYCFGRGLFCGATRNGSEFAYRELTRIRTNEFVYPKLMAWEGALATVPPECDGLYVSPEFPVFEVHEDRVLPEVVDVYFRTPSIWPQLSGASTGTNVRRRRLNPSDFLKYEMPLPPMAVQQQCRHVRQALGELALHQAKTAAELDALLPSILDKAFRGELVEAGPAVAGEVTMAASGSLFPETVQAMEDEYATDLAVAVLAIHDRAQRGREAREFHLQKDGWFAKVVLRLPVVSTFDAKAAGPWSQDLRQALEGRPARERWFILHHRPGQTGDVAQPGPNLAAGVQWANTVLGDSAGRVRGLLREIADFGDAKLELWATVLMVAQRLAEAGKPVTRHAVQRGIDTWPGKRTKAWLSRQEVDTAFDALTAKGWLKGIGKKGRTPS
jgi:hypothetical protein